MVSNSVGEIRGLGRRRARGLTNRVGHPAHGVWQLEAIGDLVVGRIHQVGQ